MQQGLFFPYAWHIDEDETERTIIRIFGLNKDNKSTALIINDFTPYVYAELPSDIEWNDTRATMLANKIDEMCGKTKPLTKALQFKKKLFYANVTKMMKSENKYRHNLYPYLLCSFASVSDRKTFCYKFGRPIKLLGIGNIKLKIHEQDANPILQFICLRNISSAGWFRFKGKNMTLSDERETTCDKEYHVRWKHCFPLDIEKDADLAGTVPSPLVLSFDIEVNSSNPSAMPSVDKPNDKVFQISCVLGSQANTGSDVKTLLSLGNPDQSIVGEDVDIRVYATEADLLMGFQAYIHEYNPQVIVGYNILGFDIPYMTSRAKQLMCFDYDRQGYIIGRHSKERIIKWSSSAYKNQEFQFLDAEGRLFVDLLPLIKRDYKFSNYKLKTVSEFFIGETKDPLTPQGIFKCYRIGISGSAEASKAMGIVGKYCVQDSALVLKLFDTIETWVGLCCMAKTCNVPIFSLYTQGQQIKVFSQVYKYCMDNNFVVEKDGYCAQSSEKFAGATVLEPIPGVYDKVVPFDFSSLYPTTIIANNIDYSTLVTDPNIPDEDCNVIEWHDHIGCEHDTTSRTTKVTEISCEYRKYRFLKEPMGVLPTLLKTLLDERKKTKNQMKDLKKQLKTITDPIEHTKISKFIVVLDKRQLAYKVSANSMYGAMGVKRGYLPFLPGAMCTTAQGRQYIELAKNTLKNKYGAEIIYGDTDSCYVHFPTQKTAQELWDYCLHVEQGILDDCIFPKPMKLAFEEVIYWRFFILTKKRYMSLACGRDGVVGTEIEKKGVLLARRDNSKWVRDIYAEIIHMIFDRKSKEDVLMKIVERFDNVCSGSIEQNNFIITKSVGDITDYKIREPPTDSKKLAKRFSELGIGLTQQETTDIINYCAEQKNGGNTLPKPIKFQYYINKNLPPQVQLAEKMRRRGLRVDPGSRIEYIVTVGPGPKAKQAEKLEDPDYQKKYSDIVKIDYLYYIKALINPLDQALEVAYGVKNFTDQQYKGRLRNYAMIKEIDKIFSTKINFN